MSCSWGWGWGFPGNSRFFWAVLWGFCAVVQMVGIPVLCPPAGGHWESGSVHHLQEWFGCHIPALRFTAGSGGIFSHIPLQRLTRFYDPAFLRLLYSKADFHPWLHRNHSFPGLSNIVLPVIPEETNEKFQSKHLPVGVRERSRDPPDILPLCQDYTCSF